MSAYSVSPVSENSGSRPPSITRSSRDNFVAELEKLPSESFDYSYELNEEVLDIEDLSDNDYSVESIESPDNVNEPIESPQANEDDSQRVGHTRNIKREESSSTESTSSVESKLDRKIRKGLEKVEKLDKILSEKVEKEKEVKQSRRALEKEFQSQVAKLIDEKGADKICGSQQLLYLCASSDRNTNMDEKEEMIEPIFPTQIDMEYYRDKDDDIEAFDNCDNSQYVDPSDNGSIQEKKSKKSKDFLKRNIQLASQAQNIVPLTDEEKRRLDELLADDTDLLLVENPFTTRVICTNGYQFSCEEQNSLEQIDALLKELVPAEEFTLSIGNYGDSQSLNLNESSDSLSPGPIVIPEVKCGERVLQDGHDERTDVYRLKTIEEKLASLQVKEEDVDSLIDPDLLRKLLDVDSRLTSDSISICDSLRSKSTLLGDIDVTTIASESEVDLNMSNTHLDVSTY